MKSDSTSCSVSGGWEASLTSWGLFGGGAILGIVASGLLWSWSLELKKAISREKRKRERATKEPWLKKRGVSTQSIVSALMVLTQACAVVYYVTGFGVSNATLCDSGNTAWRVFLDTLHAIITAGNFAVVSQILQAWLRSLNVMGERKTAVYIPSRRQGRIIIRLGIDFPMLASVIAVPLVALLFPSSWTPVSRMQVSTAARLLPALMCATIPLVYGLPMIKALASGQQESSHKLAKKMLSLLYVFVGAAFMCIPLYIAMLASALLHSVAVWAVWSAIEAIWYFILAVQLLRAFNPKQARKVQPKGPGQPLSPTFSVGRMDSFVMGLGSSSWGLTASPTRGNVSMKLFTFSPTESQPKDADAGKPAMGSSSSNPVSVERASSAASPHAFHAEQSLDSKQAERRLRHTLGSRNESTGASSPTTDTYSIADTPAAGSSTLLNAVVTDSIQSYADLKPLQQLLRAHSMRVEREQAQHAAEGSSGQPKRGGVHRVGTAPAGSRVWPIDEQVRPLQTGTTGPSSVASLSAAVSPMELSRANTAGSDTGLAENALAGGAASPRRGGKDDTTDSLSHA